MDLVWRKIGKDLGRAGEGGEKECNQTILHVILKE